MKEFTQSDTTHGNCWQTAVACILEVDPAQLPPQVEIESWPDYGVFDGWVRYVNVLNGYLLKHHGMIYQEVQRYMFGCVKPTLPEFMLIGPTIRTEQHRAAGRSHVHHVVVQRADGSIWDVHPSRAGLLEVERWGVLGKKLPDPQEEIDRKRRLIESSEGYRLVFQDCLCPACALPIARAKVAQFLAEKAESNG